MTMQFSSFARAPPVPVHQPPCPRCSWPMWLARITPYQPGYDERTFECAGCQYEQMVVVEIGQMA
jgi:hypothetical protein